MCGIIGYLGPKPVVPVLLDGLRCLEYRGYDSAGIALAQDESIEVRRSAGKLSHLVDSINAGSARRQVRHRPHALGDARQGHRG